MESSLKKESPIVLRWMNILSKEHAMLIFEASKGGIKADMASAKKLGLTKKQYYTRLSELTECGLVSKIDNTHFQTELGRLIANNVSGLQNLARDKNQTLINMVQTLVESKRFDPQELDKIRANYAL